MEAGEGTAIVRFRISRISSADVPDIDGYEKAFKAAVSYHKNKKLGGGLSDAARQVVDNIARALKFLKKGEHFSLSILDNGIGLDEKRMNSLLGDGTSAKKAELSGSYGVGHFASIPASDLRYVLYGGVLENGSHIAVGSVVLASRAGKRRPLAAEGYLVKGFLGGLDGKLYEVIDAQSIPKMVASDLSEIESEWGHGTTVVIPAFNYFGNRNRLSLWDIVSKVAAYNFNVAIGQGNLIIEIDEGVSDREDESVRRLDRHTLKDVLEQDKDGVRRARRGSAFEGLRPSGQNAYAAYLTQMEGDFHSVQTEDGDVHIRLLTPSPTGSAHVDLFRNGMWITDSIVGLCRADFTNRQPFHAVLTLNAKEGKELHRLIRKAEGPMHNELAFNRLSREESKRLTRAIQQISDKIKEEIPEVGTETYTPDDYLCVETGGDGPGSGRAQFSMWGTPVVVQRPRTSQRVFTLDAGGGEIIYERDGRGGGGGRGGGRGGSGRGNRRRNSRPLPFRSTSVPDGEGRHLIALGATQSFDEVLLSLRVDENTDATCDRVWPDEDVFFKSFSINARGGTLPNCKLEPDGRSIRIQGLSAGGDYELEIEYETSQELLAAVGTPVFRVDLQRPQTRSERSASDANAN